MTKPKWTAIKIPLGSIQAWEANPRMSSKAQAERIIASEKKFNQVIPFIVSPAHDGKVTLYDGHQRLSAWSTIYPADYVMDAMQADRDLTEDEHKELIITLHTGATGSWDWNAISSWDAGKVQEWGMDAQTLKDWNNDANNLKELLNAEVETADVEPQTDRAAELQEKWQTASGQLWQLGNHRLLIGDCTVRENVERLMSGERAGMMFTDPPYNINMKPASVARHLPDIENDNMSDNDFELFLSSFLEKAREVVDGSVYVCCDWRKYHIFFLCLEKVGWGVKNLIVWNKSVRAQNLNKWAFIHEFICYNGFMGAPTLGENVWTVKREFSDVHLTPKPVELVEKAIKAESGDIYEPFAGSGTTIIAAENLSRRCYAMEISEKYGAVILERFATAFPAETIQLLDVPPLTNGR